MDMARLRLSFCLALLPLLFVSITWAQSNSADTVPLASLTELNTSASPSFRGFDNGDIAPANVSKVSFRELLPPGSVGMVLAQYQPWFGSRDHKNVGYRTDDPAQVRRQVDDMMSRGIDGVVLAWYGSLQ